MSIKDRPFFAGIDQLLLAGHVLRALEIGRLPMHPGDYQAIAAETAELLAQMDHCTLCRLHAEGPLSLRSIVDNVMFDQRAAAPKNLDAGRMQAERVWIRLCERLVASRNS
jgi:hypothetical protein